MKKSNQIFIIALVMTLAFATASYGIVFYPSVASVGTGDIASRHILNGTILNEDISSSAYIDYSKLATTTDNQFLVSSSTIIVAKDATSSRAAMGLGTVATYDAVNNSVWSGEDLSIANGGTGTSTAAGARENLGLVIGSDVMAYDPYNATTGSSITGNAGTATALASDPTDCAASNVAMSIDASGNLTCGQINNAYWSGEDLSIANGGTGTSTAAGARENLGLGTIATQSASNVSITGGSITGITDLSTADGGTGQSWDTVATGSIPYFNGEGTMSTLAPGTSGYFLKTQGAGADPVWAEAKPKSVVHAEIKNTAQSIETDTWTKLQYNTTTIDVLNEYDESTNYRFTATTAGYYSIFAQGAIGTLSADKTLGLRIYKNGTTTAETIVSKATADDACANIYTIEYLAVNDYIEVYIYHDQGLSKNTCYDEHRNLLIIRRVY